MMGGGVNVENLSRVFLFFIYLFIYLSPPRGGAPFLEVLQYQVDAWSGRSKLLFQLPAPKIHLIYCPRIEDVSDIKLIKTDTTLDLSQKAEKRWAGCFYKHSLKSWLANSSSCHCIRTACILSMASALFFFFGGVRGAGAVPGLHCGTWAFSS